MIAAHTPAEPMHAPVRRDWTAYNASQRYEKPMIVAMLRELCAAIPDAPAKLGRPPLPLGRRIFYSAMLVHGGKSSRRTIADLLGFEVVMGSVPSANALLVTLGIPAVTQLLEQMIERTAAAASSLETDFAVDSTGFRTCGPTKEPGRRKTSIVNGKNAGWVRARWVKAHAMVAVRTNVVTSVDITASNVNDYGRLPKLVNGTSRRFDLRRVSADKAYSGRSNLVAIESAGARPLIPFRHGEGRGFSVKAGVVGQETWRRLFDDFIDSRDAFMRAHNLRMNVETAFHMIKARFGGRVRSRTMPAQMNEILLKVLLHNLCCLVRAYFEHGIEIDLS